MIERKLKTTVTKHVAFTKEDLCEAFNLPKDARIFVQVPGGGDWSNTNLHIGSDCLLEVEFSVTTEKKN